MVDSVQRNPAEERPQRKQSESHLGAERDSAPVSGLGDTTWLGSRRLDPITRTPQEDWPSLRADDYDMRGLLLHTSVPDPAHSASSEGGRDHWTDGQ